MLAQGLTFGALNEHSNSIEGCSVSHCRKNKLRSEAENSKELLYTKAIDGYYYN